MQKPPKTQVFKASLEVFFYRLLIHKTGVSVAELGVASDFPTRVVSRQVGSSHVARKRVSAPVGTGLVGRPRLHLPHAWAGA
jgi:hypothetical protein